MSECLRGWEYTDDQLLLRGVRPSSGTIENALMNYEREGCTCGKGLDCPLMKYLLTGDSNDASDGDWDEDDWDDSDEEDDPVVDDSDYHDPSDDVDMSNYDFTDNTYEEQEEDFSGIVEETFSEPEPIQEQPYARDYTARTSAVADLTDSAVRMQQENRLLREKLSEMELQVNQQLREISSRQDQQGQVETKMSTLQKANRELIWATNTCLKMLKHLPDSSKLNFRNSRDFAKMLEIYKEYVEPSKEAIR